jgi:glyoxylate/hydroxypyruvate reductase A
MVVVLVTPRAEQAEVWRSGLAALLGDIEFRVYPDVGDPGKVDVALAWKAPHGVLATFPNLRLICSLGMGVDHLLQDPGLPRSVPIARLVDANMVEQMSEYVLYGVLHFHRRFDVYGRYQREKRWEELPLPHTAMRQVGIMGIGEIGSDSARKLAALNFPVRGWSRSLRSIPGVKCYAGREQLSAFLSGLDILVSVLPLTDDTHGIVNANLLSELSPESYFINVARGGLVVEDDLLAALDSGHLAGTLLDVTALEPLPASSSLWTHPKVLLTPHIAGLTNPITAVHPIAENIRRVAEGRPILYRVDSARGY